MKKILMLGGSNCQKNAIIRGRELGYEMIVADYLDAPIAAAYAHNHVKASTFDFDACISAANEFDVDGVMTVGTDQPVLTVSRVAEALGLPSSLNPWQAKALTNKKEMKKIFYEFEIPTLPYKLVKYGDHIEKDDDFSGPVVIKPLDSQGQRGVFKLENIQKVEEYVKRTLSFSRLDEVLIEPYYESDEITISGWVSKDSIEILTITDRILYNDPLNIGICTSHKFPSKHMDKYEKIKEITEKIVRAFKIKNGPIYIQMLVGKYGIIVNEAAARIGGAFEDIIIPKITGFSILDAVILSTIGIEPDIEPLKNYECESSKYIGSVQLMFADPGKISYITPIENLLKIPNVVDAGYNFKVGEEILEFEDARGRFGHFVIVGEADEAEKSLRIFKEEFKILDENGKNLYKGIK